MRIRAYLVTIAILLLIGNGFTFAASDGGVEEAQRQLSVMTFNLRYASTNRPNSWVERRPVMRECIERTNPDLIGTQEGLYPQLKDLAADLPQYDWIGLGRDGGSRGEFMAVFYRKSRFDPLQYEHFWLSDTPAVTGSSTWGHSNRRMVTWVRFLDRQTRQEFYLWNTHLDHAVQPARERGAELIRTRIEELKTDLPVLLIGDFNAVAGENLAYSILVDRGGFTDIWHSARQRRGQNVRTFHDFKGPVEGDQRIDWILTRGAVQTDSIEIVTFSKNGQYPSDHFPVIASVRLGVAQPPPQSREETSASQQADRTNLLRFRTDQGTVTSIRTADDWPRRRAAILENAQKVMGSLPGEEKRCPLDLRIENESDCGTFVRQSITYASEPGARVPAYLLVPKAALVEKSPRPAVLALHQTHALGNKVVVGLGKSADDEYGVELVERGFVVLAPAYPLLADYAPDLKQLGYQSGTMKAIWDNVRGLDLLDSLPFVQHGRYAAIGHSLGGHNSIFTAVFDERVRVIVSSCGFDSFCDYMDGNIKGWTSERYMPRLLDYSIESIPFDFHELVAALAPRTCFISAPIGDTNFKWRSVDTVAAAARPVYTLFNASERLRVEHPDCAHSFPKEMRTEAYKLIEAQLKR